MKKFIVLILCVVFCMGLTGCTYGSANMIRAQGGDIFVFWGTGWVKTQNASVTIFRSMDVIQHMKNGTAYPKIPTRPTITEEGEGGSINIGKAQKLNQVPTTPVERGGLLEQTVSQVKP